MKTASTCAAALLLAAAAARAGDEPKWERREFECKRPDSCDAADCCKYGFAIYTREKPGQSVREVRAVGEMDASPESVFEAVTDYEHQKDNLPYVKDCKVFRRTQDEVLFWALADFPMVAARDWVLRARLERNVEGGVWRASWKPAPEVAEAPAPREGVVRITTNIGSWTMEPLDGGKRTRATYALFTDPGGSIPSFIANKANTKALPDLFAAIRKRVEPKTAEKAQPKEAVSNQ